MSGQRVSSADRAARLKRLCGHPQESSYEDILWVAEHFSIPPVAKVEEFAKKGNINHTYLVVDETGTEFLLQKINSDVFKKPRRVMRAMIEWIETQHRHLESGKAPSWTIWKPITLMETVDGEKMLDLSTPEKASVWRLMVMIPDTITCKSLAEVPTDEQRMHLAQEMGRGLALNSDFTSGMKLDGLRSSLPGYRDTQGYYSQLHATLRECRSLDDAKDVLPKDDELRESTQDQYLVVIDEREAARRREDPDLTPFINLALDQEKFALSLGEAVESGLIRRSAIHGDTKIENFLFCRDTGNVTSLVDLDTIMPYTWLADWGDMMRSLCNVAGEKERDLDKVQVDKQVYENVAKGFLSTATEVTGEEVDLMADSVKVISMELGIRFLTDYLRGDNYFQLGPDDPEDLNKVRAMVQLTLYQRLSESDNWAKGCIAANRPAGL
jgi:hypothetical protein